MSPQCIQAVQEAATASGRERPLTDAQINDIDARIRRTMRNLARTEEGWQGLSPSERIGMAAKQAVEDIAAEAQRKVTNAHLQILKTADTEARIESLLKQHEGDKRAHALVKDMDQTGTYIQGIKMEAMGSMIRLIDAVKAWDGASGGRRAAMFLFDADNPQMTRDLAAEVFANADGHTGNKVAQEGAKAWLKTIDELRQRFNSAGGDVGKLDYGYLPQPHDSARVRAAGLEKWVAQMLPLLDRTRYLDEAGARMSDVEMTKMLDGVWDTIQSDGIVKREPGAYKGSGARANSGSEHRELHFKDADSFLQYMADYGRGSMYDSMVSHIGGIARDIGLVERYGPNPNATMRLQFDLAAAADKADVDNLPRSFGMRPQSYWDQINGTATSPASARLAQIGTDMRNIQTFGKLAGAVISSITDVGTYIVTTGYNRLSYWDAIANYAKVAGSKDARDFLTTHGIISESMIGDMNRWTGDNIKQTWSGRLAQSTLKLSLMNAWTDTLRRAFSLTMMQGLARLSKTEWGKLGEWDRMHLERKGITAEDWAVITKAELTEFSGAEHLTPESIRKVAEDVFGQQVTAPMKPAAHEAMRRAEATAARTNADKMKSELAAVHQAIDADASRTPDEKVELRKRESARSGAASAEATRLENALDRTVAKYQADYFSLSAQHADTRASQIIATVLGLIQDESEFAVINPDLATKTLGSGGGVQRGTVKGELARSVMQFKSFPIAMVSRHWRRMLDAPKVSDGSAPLMANRLMYTGSMLVTTTALGAIALQAKQVVSGKDPIDMTGPHAAKFWAKAAAQGGGLSIVGDMLLNDPGNSTSDAVRSMMGTAAGPVASTVAQGAAIGIENAWKAAKDKKTHAAAEMISLVRQNAPYVNVWYAKVAIDHAGMHAIQENLSPGYLGKMKQRAQKDFGQSYWWQPGSGGPDRAPDFGKAVGQ